jgi:uncharacterized protein YyaL (SSP411 family)
LIQAYRYLGDEKSLEKAQNLIKRLFEKHYDGKLHHSSLERAVQKDEFLEDYAAMLLFLTYLEEETGEYSKEMGEFSKKILTFKKGDIWIESNNKDFRQVPAKSFDSPAPSSISMAELGLRRADILLKRDYAPQKFKQPVANDFFNISALLTNGFFHIIESPERISWEKLSGNIIQIRGNKLTDCYKGACKDSLD